MSDKYRQKDEKLPLFTVEKINPDPISKTRLPIDNDFEEMKNKIKNNKKGLTPSETK